jgi:Transposase zinc-binding domain
VPAFNTSATARNRPPRIDSCSSMRLPSVAQVETVTGSALPKFVKDEFDAFLECGILAHGFLRLRCGDCAHDKLVAFSCKRRCFCPSCRVRRMSETAANLNIHLHCLVLDGVYRTNAKGEPEFVETPAPSEENCARRPPVNRKCSNSASDHARRAPPRSPFKGLNLMNRTPATQAIG